MMANNTQNCAVAIIGAGALGRLAANILHLNQVAVMGFYDDGIASGTVIDGIEVKGGLDQFFSLKGVGAIIGVGDIAGRRKIYERCLAGGVKLVSAVHPSASIASTAVVGQGCLIKEFAVLEIGVTLGDNCIVGNRAVICHDTRIGSHCRLAPGVSIAGYALIEDECYLAVNVAVDRKITVGARSVIASGCTIWENVPPESLVKLPQKMIVSPRRVNA